MEGPRVVELARTFRQRQSQWSPGRSEGRRASLQEPVCYGGETGPSTSEEPGAGWRKASERPGPPHDFWVLGPATCRPADCSPWTQDWIPLHGLTLPSVGTHAGSIPHGLDGRAKLTPPSWASGLQAGLGPQFGLGGAMSARGPSRQACGSVGGCWAAALAPPRSPALRGSQKGGGEPLLPHCPPKTVQGQTPSWKHRRPLASWGLS